MLDSILVTSGSSLMNILILLASAMALGVLNALIYSKQNRCTSSFALTLATLPVITGAVILVVNGNLGSGLAVAGAFSLLRFRSVQGRGREILAIFLSMALGLCLGAGYLAMAGLLFIACLIMSLMLPLLHVGEGEKNSRELRISVPESLDYEGIFESIMDRFGIHHELIRVKTADMGSTYQLTYHVSLPHALSIRELLDEIRTENGNLPVSLGHIQAEQSM